MQRTHLLFGPLVLGALALCSPAHAWEFRCRFIERVGTTNLDLPNNSIDASNGNPRRIRIQFGVFDDADSPAPPGGFVGWNVGTLSVSGAPDNSTERRTPGRISPFNFSGQPSANGYPPVPPGGETDFQQLTQIDATLGTQSLPWTCGPDGLPLPMPQAVVRGLNSYVSTYEITIDPATLASSYSIACAGNLIAATEWRTIGTPTPPDCSPDCGPIDCDYGSVTYAPLTAPPRSFSCTLQVFVPAPAAAPALLALLALAPGLHRRRAIR